MASSYDSLFMISGDRPIPRSVSSSSSNRGKGHSGLKLNGLGRMSSFDVLNAVDDCLEFTGEWKEFLGRPSKNFYMNISSQPGDGKSTFAIRFANYLATDFGKVIYVTNEEDAARIKLKLNQVGKLAKFDFDFEARTMNDIAELVEEEGYNHVFIDSAQNAGIDYKELWNFHINHPYTSMVVISRQTKSGCTRGSQNKEYDGDITITFPKKGLAQTIKNRFNDLKKYVVF